MREFAEGVLGVFVYSAFFQVISEKKLCSNEFTKNLRIYKIIDYQIIDINYDSYKFGYIFVFIPFLTFRRNHNQEPNFHQVGSVDTENFFCCCYTKPHSTSKVY